MSTKAVHVELVSELTASAYIASLSRFVSRRGIPSNIYSDNGTNFVGANRELKEIYEYLKANSSTIKQSLADDHITWPFIPARSPSFGGLWEAGIKSAKHHLKRVMANNAFTFEELYTIITRVEAILNSRPLTPLSQDPDDIQALTPGHFLIGRSLTSLPELTVTSLPVNRLSRWQLVQAIIQHYWTRWHKEYISELQTRQTWKKDGANNLKVGSLVLLKEDGVPVQDWRLGRIVEMQPGADGRVRVCKGKARQTVVTRAVNRLCLLPVETVETDNETN
nr:unnamed protein product [Callosobruchus analis]